MTADEVISSAKIGLSKTKRKASFLGIFYNELNGYDKRIFSIMAGLIKKFEPEIIFNAVIDYYITSGERPLVYFCQTRYNRQQTTEIDTTPAINLNDYMKERLVNG